MCCILPFNDRFKALRLEHNLSQQQVAANTGLTDTTIQNYEYGARKPAYDGLIAIADLFDVSLDYLAGRTDNPNVNR